MPIPRSLRRWLRLPGRVALILGLGALSTAGARADPPDRAHRMAFGDILIRSEGGKIYLTEGGQEAELRLTATPQRDHLLRLLEEHGPSGVKLDHDPRLIMSSGGGAGFYWWGGKKSTTDKAAPTGSAPPPRGTTVPEPPARGPVPEHNPTNDRQG
jgi:hypothetical protein